MRAGGGAGDVRLRVNALARTRSVRVCAGTCRVLVTCVCMCTRSRVRVPACTTRDRASRVRARVCARVQAAVTRLSEGMAARGQPAAKVCLCLCLCVCVHARVCAYVYVRVCVIVE